VSAAVDEPAAAIGNCAYGPVAERWAQRLPAALPLVTCELGAVTLGFADAARRRKRGEVFGASIFITDGRAKCALYIGAPPILAQVTDFDERAQLLDCLAAGGLQVGGREQRAIEQIEPPFLRASSEYLATADVVVTRSAAERERLSTLLGRRFLHVAEVAPLDSSVPAPPRGSRRRDAIVVWAPGLPAEACGLFAYALEEMRLPVLIVSAGGQPAPMRPGTRFVGIADAVDALSRALIIIDASLDDPGTARALARFGVPLAVASCSGAADWLGGVAVYDPWAHLSVTAAAGNALGGCAPYERRASADTDEFARVLAAATPPRRSAGPLVSVIVPTLNARSSLRDAVASIAAQTYAPIELVIVNDGGPPVDPGLLAHFGCARVIDQPERGGIAEALNAGIAASSGTYIAALADDDLYCPDHLARLVTALERTGCDVAHSIELREHYEPRPDGSYALLGHSVMVGVPARPSALLLCNMIGGTAVMFSRRAWQRVGTFDERAGCVSDLEMWMQFAEHFDFVHVDRVTAIMSARTDGTQFSAVGGRQTAEFYRYAYRLHPTGRPALERARTDWLARLETQPATNLPHIVVRSGSAPVATQP
jgi:glycosyltransferase involved in cell wall biosynthesis